MAIAANFKRYAMAMALQLVLPFGRPVWNSKRCTTRVGRYLRALRGRLAAAHPRIVYPVRPVYCQRPKETRRLVTLPLNWFTVEPTSEADASPR